MKDKSISSRQVIKAILDNKELFKFPEDIQRFAVIIEDLPSMDKPRGKWIGYEVPSKCSVCGHDWDEYISGQEIWYDGTVPNFCPNCGAYMSGRDDEKECHKPESESYRAYCEEWKDEIYCEGCKFWY